MIMTVFVVRPVVASVCLIGSDLGTPDRALVSLGGLKGAVPLLLAGYPALEHFGDATLSPRQPSSPPRPPPCPRRYTSPGCRPSLEEVTAVQVGNAHAFALERLVEPVAQLQDPRAR